MATRSGTVYNYTTLATVSGATVFSLKASTQEIFASGVSNGSGEFTVDIDTSQDVVYIPYKSAFEAYHRYLPQTADNVALYLSDPSYAQPSGIGDLFTHLVGSTLKTSSNVLDCKVTPCYGFVITDNGLDIFQLDDQRNVGFVVHSGGFSALAVTPDRCEKVLVCLGTTSGVAQLLFNPTNPPLTNNYSGQLEFPAYNSFLPSLVITKLAQTTFSGIAIATTSGVAVVTSGGTYSHSFSDTVTAMAVTSSGDLYYGVGTSGVLAKYGPIVNNWTAPDYSLSSISTPALLSDTINHIEVSTVSGYNHLFIATNSGVSIVKETRSNISSSPVQSLNSVISGATLNVTDTASDTSTTISGGKLYLSTLSGTVGTVQFIDLATNSGGTPYLVTDFESNLKFAGKAISGSAFIERR